MNAAIVQEGVVINLIVIEEEAIPAYKQEMSLGLTLVPSEEAAIGDLYDGVSFTKPNEE